MFRLMSARQIWPVVAAVFLFALPFSAQAVPVGDGFRADGTPWDPEGDPSSKLVFELFDASAVAPHVRPEFENLKPADRPPHFRAFLVAWLVLVPLFLVAALVLSGLYPGGRRSRAPDVSKRAIPDDILPVAVAMLLALAVRLIAAALLPLHGSEWGSVEHKPLSALPDILFNGYEVLTNPSLLNLVEHFVFPICFKPFCFRIPLVISGVAMVWAARCAARELAGRRAGIIVAFLVAINAGLIVWSATMRAYLPMATVILAALPAAFRMSRGPGSDRDVVLLGLFGALAVWTHYIAWIWLGLYFTMIAWGRRRNMGHLLRPVVAGAFVVVSFLPLVPFFFGSFGDKQGSSLPPGWAGHMLALATGMPGPVGLVVPAGILAARFHKSRGAVWLAAICAGYVGMCLATSPIIFWEVSYSVGLSAVVAVLAAVVLDSIRRPGMAIVIVIAAMLAPSVLICLEPSDNAIVAKMTRPFLWRSVSVEKFSDSIMKAPVTRDGRPDVVLVTPAFESESFLYHLGPVTPEQAGVEPVIVRNFDEMKVPSMTGRDAITLIGFERYWGWHLGQWPELERFLTRFDRFWYARMQQSCARREGMTWSSFDCTWLERHCELLESTAFDELYLCSAEHAGPGQ